MNVLHIALRELRATYTTAVGWLVLCGWLVITGLFWRSAVTNYVIESQGAGYNPYGESMTLGSWVLGPYFGNCAVLLMMVLPAVSMRSFAEEHRQNTLPLLMTSPVSSLEITLGKYLGLLAVQALLLLGTLTGPLMLYVWSSPDPGVVFGGYLALFLLGAGILAVGMAASSLTSSQLVAFGISIAVVFALLAVGWLSSEPGDPMSHLSILSHLTGALEGAVKLSDVVYLVGFAAIFVFATWQRMESFRWQ
ncbi:MAG: ABC transporter permease [Myxococcota bacterium]